MDKNELRRFMLKKRNGLFATEHERMSQAIFNKIINDERFLNAHHIGLYVSFNSEVETIKLIQYCLVQGKKVSVPKVSGETMEFYEIDDLKKLQPGAFGVLEPIGQIKTEKNSIDIIYVPLLAYDSCNQRIGYGKGYYDRYLSDFDNLTIGIAFSFQKVAHIETNPFDFPLDFIYNET